MQIVVLAGGGGTRLWPLSDPACPKPFLPLLGAETLIQRTVARVRPLADASAVTVVTDQRYEALVRQQLPDVRVVAEPVGRNTAAAVALAALAVEGPPDEVMAILPADHVIADEPSFVRLLAAAAKLAGGSFGVSAPLLTLGVAPDRPATEYGYLLPRLDARIDVDGIAAYPLAAFEEKPSVPRAEELLGLPGTAWNAGIFVWQRRAIRDAFAHFAGDILATVSDGLDRGALAEAYADVRATPVDRAILEPAAAEGLVAMAATAVGWSDLGSWTVLLAELGGHGSGRVVPPGEAAEAGPDDLVVERIDGQLLLHDGPRGILAEGPVAVLSGAAPDKALVDALIRRTAATEGSS